MSVIGGAEGDRLPDRRITLDEGQRDRTSDLRIANRTTGKTLSICLFESCSHQEKSMVFPFFPIPYHRVSVASCFFWPRIGHSELTSKSLASIGSSNQNSLVNCSLCTLISITKKIFQSRRCLGRFLFHQPMP